MPGHDAVVIVVAGCDVHAAKFWRPRIVETDR